MNARVNCVSNAATQQAPKIGHNRAPKTEPFGIRALWLHFANERELRRLAKLHTRLTRLKSREKEIIGERQLIMNRCIRRMRRAGGKN